MLNPPMHALMFIRRAIFGLIRQIWLLPQSVANAVQQRRRQIVPNELEAERLDRIRNPDKYLGSDLETDVRERSKKN